MTCTTCGSPDDVAEREGVVLCRACSERLDWARIIEIVQQGVRMKATVGFDGTVGADPFA